MKNHPVRDAVGGVIGCILFSFFFVFVVVNWLPGCGETFHGANGQIIHGECVSFYQMFLGG